MTTHRSLRTPRLCSRIRMDGKILVYCVTSSHRGLWLVSGECVNSLCFFPVNYTLYSRFGCAVVVISVRKTQTRLNLLPSRVTRDFQGD